ncbi:MAG: sugar transferase [Caldilineaceae bacterium]
MQQNPSSLSWVWSRFPCTLFATAYPYTQRLLDIFISLLGLLFLELILPFLWLANLFLAPGPLFYRQTRVGLCGRPFTLIKLRSMVVTAEQNGAVWTAEGDPRITRVGHFLRRTHLDELPQCWNVLKGEMSLIGPRPERPEFVTILTEQIEGYTQRHAVKPGLTGWAQVNYEYGDSVEDARIKLKYDLEYIEWRSWRLDLLIVLRTFRVILKGR